MPKFTYAVTFQVESAVTIHFEIEAENWDEASEEFAELPNDAWQDYLDAHPEALIKREDFGEPYVTAISRVEK